MDPSVRWTFKPIQGQMLSNDTYRYLFFDLTERMYKIPKYCNTIESICYFLHNQLVSFITLMNPHPGMVLMLLDKRKYVPIEKKQEQDKRRKSSSTAPYPPHTPLSSLENTIDTTRLAISASVVSQFVDVFLNYITYHQPYLCDILCDLQEDQAPLYIRKGLSSSHNEYSEFYNNQIGESEMRIFYYVHLFQQQHLHISQDTQYEITDILRSKGLPDDIIRHRILSYWGQSNVQYEMYIADSDCIPIGLQYLNQHPSEHMTLLWIRDQTTKIYKDPNHIRGVNITLLNQGLLEGKMTYIQEIQRPEMRPMAYILWCLLGGSDYFSKYDMITQDGLLHYIGLDGILKSISETLVYTHYSLGCYDSKFIQYLLCSVYGTMCGTIGNSGIVYIQTYCHSLSYDHTMRWIEYQVNTLKPTNNYKIPTTIQTFTMHYVKIYFNWKYWELGYQNRSLDECRLTPEIQQLHTATSGTQSTLNNPKQQLLLPTGKQGTLIRTQSTSTLSQYTLPLLEHSTQSQPIEIDQEEYKSPPVRPLTPIPIVTIRSISAPSVTPQKPSKPKVSVSDRYNQINSMLSLPPDFS
jgi:hypothetical protein